MTRPKGPRAAFAAVAVLLVLSSVSAAEPAIRWVTGYYASYSEGTVGLHPSDVDYTALTHVIHWPVVPLAGGTFDPNTYGLTAAQSADLVARAHAAGVKAILGFGGDAATVGNGWQGATSPANRAAFIANMVNLMQARGYDGIDINWEELTLVDQAQFTALVNELRAALDAISPRPLLTVVPTSGSDVPVTLIAPLQSQFDQINIQTYVMSGPYPGWITWFNSPIFNGGQMFPGGGLVPSADNEVDRFTGGGIPVGNLGIGIQFDGAVWTGGSGMATGGPSQPRQPLNNLDPPTMTFMRTADIITTFTPPDFIKTFDTIAKVPWIGRDAAADADDRFISYDDEQAIQEKATYIGQKGLGGVFVFELSGDFFPGATGDARHPLLTALRNAFRSFDFADVPAGYWAYAYIQALARAGVTSGCATSPLRYCPDAPVTREQMAVFLLKARYGADFTPGACATDPFADVPCANPFAPWIQELVSQGITAGCGGGNYCPTSPVTREQMAVFLLKARYGADFTPGACAATFTDVPCSSPFAAWIQELVSRGITAGCAPGLYCPGDPVTRAQMAVFLVKTFALPL